MACLLNAAAAMDSLPLPDAERLLPLFRTIALTPRIGSQTSGIAQDRLFAWVDPSFRKIIEAHGDLFHVESDVLHPGGTGSHKEVRFGEGNLQFTYHDNELSPSGTDWKKIEIDLDCFSDKGAHFLLEVIPNELSKRLGRPRLTDPAEIYALRWMAGRHAGEKPPFAPLYSLRAN